MIKVGLTGNIGSGKSTVASVFKSLGVPVFYADIEARKVLLDDKVIEILADSFGKSILEGEEVNRAKLAAVVFNDNKALETLNSIIHPKVRQALMNWMETKHDYKYIIQEAAILFESGFYQFFDKNIVVSCPEDVAVKRVMERDGVTKLDVISRIKNQWTEAEKIKLANYTILNDGNNLIIPQILSIHKKLSQ